MAAKRVLIVGGGAVGVELAAEILVDLPGEPDEDVPSFWVWQLLSKSDSECGLP